MGLVTALVRYLQLRHDADWNESDRFVLIRFNKVALVFGIVSSLGASIVANFQVSNENLHLGTEDFIRVYIASSKHERVWRRIWQ